MSKIKIILDREKCIAATPCISIAPKYFKLVDGKATLLGSKIDEGTGMQVLEVDVEDAELDSLRNAASSCPVQVIKVIE